MQKNVFKTTGGCHPHQTNSNQHHMGNPNSAEPLVDDATVEIPCLSRTLSEPLPDATEEEETKAEEKKEPKRKARPSKAKADSDPDQTGQDAPKRAKRAKKDPGDPSAPQAPNEDQPKPTTEQPKSKRGQARPHRRLDTEAIVARIEKLDRRIHRAQAQLVDATRHVQSYRREMKFRPSLEGKEGEKTLEEKLEESIEGEA